MGGSRQLEKYPPSSKNPFSQALVLPSSVLWCWIYFHFRLPSRFSSLAMFVTTRLGLSCLHTCSTRRRLCLSASRTLMRLAFGFSFSVGTAGFCFCCIGGSSSPEMELTLLPSYSPAQPLSCRRRSLVWPTTHCIIHFFQEQGRVHDACTSQNDSHARH